MKNIHLSLTQKILLIIAVLFTVPLFFATKGIVPVFTQTRDKTEKEVKQLTFKNDPIEIVSIKTSSRTIKFGEKFIQEKDWLKDLTVEVKSVSDKPILSALLRLDFPETRTPAPGGYMMVYSGLLYGNSLTPKPGDGEPLRPGQSVIADVRQFANIKRFIEKRFPLDDLTQVVVYVEWVYFEDGTSWSMGDFQRPDPNNPGKFIIYDPKKSGENQ